MKERETMQVVSSGRVSVRTKFLGPTGHRGSRVKVSRCDHRSGDKTLTVGWDYSLNVEENHADAIRQFLDLMGWDGVWVVGAGDDGFIGVRVGDES